MKNDRLSRLLAHVTLEHNEIFEDAVLNVYADVLACVTAAAKHGLRCTRVRPNMDTARSGALSKIFPSHLMAEICARLLVAEGVDAAVRGDTIFVSWPAVPPHWGFDN